MMFFGAETVSQFPSWVSGVLAILGALSGTLGLLWKVVAEAKKAVETINQLGLKVRLDQEDKDLLVSTIDASHKKTCALFHPVPCDKPNSPIRP